MERPLAPLSGFEGAEHGPKVARQREVELSSWIALGVVLVAAIWLYFPAIDKPFFADDFLFLDQVRGRSLTDVLTAPDPLSNFYRPVGRQLYFWLTARAAGESPRVFHAVNLGLFLAILVLLFALTRRLAGARAGVLASALVAFHYSAEVPVRWAGGAQELLAVAGSLAALLLYVSGRRWLAGAALLFAALSKETALVTPVVALLLDKRREESWKEAARRLLPLGIAIAVWVTLWVAMPERRAQMANNVALKPLGPIAAMVHLVQVAIGLEWRHGELGHLPRSLPSLLPVALIAAAVTWAGLRATRGGARGVKAGADENRSAKKAASRTATREVRRASGARAKQSGEAKAARSKPERARAKAWGLRVGVVTAGLLWAVVASLPVAVVADIWSAYYYLFAICGLALGAGAWLAPRPWWWGVVVIVLAGIGSASARGLDEFSTAQNLWGGQSHVNRFYIDRANRFVTGYLGSLKRAHPSLPPRSTLFYSGLMANTAFQTADGPLVRWAYQDTSLRSHYIKFFTREKAKRGPIFFLIAQGDTLRDATQDPDFLQNFTGSMIVTDEAAGASEVIEFWRQTSPRVPARDYWNVWLTWGMGDTVAARREMESLGLTLARGATREFADAIRLLSARDTVSAFRIVQSAALGRYALDQPIHGLFADLLLIRDPNNFPGAVEAYAARVLDPRDPIAWKRWGLIQARHERYKESRVTFEHYFAMLGDKKDPEAERWLDAIRGQLPGSAAVQEALRK